VNNFTSIRGRLRLLKIYLPAGLVLLINIRQTLLPHHPTTLAHTLPTCSTSPRSLSGTLANINMRPENGRPADLPRRRTRCPGSSSHKIGAGITKRLASRLYQLKTGHCLTGQYLEWTKIEPTAKCWWRTYRAQTRGSPVQKLPPLESAAELPVGGSAKGERQKKRVV
jgi:hypothetical protein